MVNQEGIKFIIFLLFFVILIPLIISFIYIYKTTDVYYKSKKILKNKVDNPVLCKCQCQNVFFLESQNVQLLEFNVQKI